MSSSLLEHLRDAAPSVLAGRGVAFAYLFGSQVTGRARPDSDVDIAVHLSDHPAAVHDPLALRLDVARGLATATGIGNIEVVIFGELPLPLRGRIVNEREVIYSADEPARVAVESRVAREYGDYQIAFRGLGRELLAAIAEGRR